MMTSINCDDLRYVTNDFWNTFAKEFFRDFSASICFFLLSIKDLIFKNYKLFLSYQLFSFLNSLELFLNNSNKTNLFSKMYLFFFLINIVCFFLCERTYQVLISSGVYCTLGIGWPLKYHVIRKFVIKRKTLMRIVNFTYCL